MSGGVEVWRGSANAWECDEMGHMNVRFYVAKWQEAMGWTAALVGLPQAFGANASSTIVPLEQHIRFLAEARAGAPLAMLASTVRVGERDALLLHEMRHADGRPAAAFVSRVAHVEGRSGKEFPWSAKTRAAFEAMSGPVPEHAAPRSIDPEKPGCPTAGLIEADRLGVPRAGRVMVGAGDVDALGRMRAEMFIGRVSDSVPNLLHAWRAQAVKEASKAGEAAMVPGSAVLEYRLLYRRWPKAGDLIEVRSGVVEVAAKTQRLAHWLIDPIRGDAWATAEAVAVTFDLATRKTIAIPASMRAALAARVVEGLTL